MRENSGIDSIKSPACHSEHNFCHSEHNFCHSERSEESHKSIKHNSDSIESKNTKRLLLFDKVLENITKACFIRDKINSKTTLGAQFVLLKQNAHSLSNAAKVLKKAGLNYLSIKPFNLQSENQKHRETPIDPKFLAEILKEAKSFEDENFKVIFRENTFSNNAEFAARSKEQNTNSLKYPHCLGCSFISVLNSAGDLATCLPFWDKEEFVYGNIYKNYFYDIWNGAKRAKIKYFLENEIDCAKCPPNCRQSAINEYLWEIFHPKIAHKNFI